MTTLPCPLLRPEFTGCLYFIRMSFNFLHKIFWLSASLTQSLRSFADYSPTMRLASLANIRSAHCSWSTWNVIVFALASLPVSFLLALLDFIFQCDTAVFLPQDLNRHVHNVWQCCGRLITNYRHLVARHGCVMYWHGESEILITPLGWIVFWVSFLNVYFSSPLIQTTWQPLAKYLCPHNTAPKSQTRLTPDHSCVESLFSFGSTVVCWNQRRSQKKSC